MYVDSAYLRRNFFFLIRSSKYRDTHSTSFGGSNAPIRCFQENPKKKKKISYTGIMNSTVLGQVFGATWLPTVRSRYCSYAWVRNIHPKELLYFLTVLNEECI